jgi:hypothetical protein
MSKKIPMIVIPGKLTTQYGRSPSYRRIWLAAADARFPADQLENGRWLADPADVAAAFGLSDDVRPTTNVSAIAETLGMTVAA